MLCDGDSYQPVNYRDCLQRNYPQPHLGKVAVFQNHLKKVEASKLPQRPGRVRAASLHLWAAVAGPANLYHPDPCGSGDIQLGAGAVLVGHQNRQRPALRRGGCKRADRLKRCLRPGKTPVLCVLHDGVDCKLRPAWLTFSMGFLCRAYCHVCALR